MKWLIYTLVDPREPNDIRYVGITKSSLKRRLTQHISDAKCKIFDNRHLFNFIRNLLKNNLLPEIELLEETTIDMWEESEIYWIAQFKNWGFDLVNTSPGGRLGGVSSHSEETKNKIRNKLKSKSKEWHEKRLNNIIKSRKGTKHSRETIELMKANNKKTMLNKTHSSEAREKIRQANLGKKKTEEQKRLMSIRNKGENNPMFGKKMTEEQKMKMRENYKRKIYTDEERKYMSEKCLSKKSVKQYDLEFNFINEFESIKQASIKTKICKTGISACCRGIRNKAGGYIWKYKY